jgi:hypothetical protein
MNALRITAAILAVAASAPAQSVETTYTSSDDHRVLIELFTSQG